MDYTDKINLIESVYNDLTEEDRSSRKIRAIIKAKVSNDSDLTSQFEDSNDIDNAVNEFYTNLMKVKKATTSVPLTVENSVNNTSKRPPKKAKEDIDVNDEDSFINTNEEEKVDSEIVFESADEETPSTPKSKKPRQPRAPTKPRVKKETLEKTVKTTYPTINGIVVDDLPYSKSIEEHSHDEVELELSFKPVSDIDKAREELFKTLYPDHDFNKYVKLRTASINEIKKAVGDKKFKIVTDKSAKEPKLILKLHKEKISYEVSKTPIGKTNVFNKFITELKSKIKENYLEYLNTDMIRTHHILDTSRVRDKEDHYIGTYEPLFNYNSDVVISEDDPLPDVPKLNYYITLSTLCDYNPSSSAIFNQIYANRCAVLSHPNVNPSEIEKAWTQTQCNFKNFKLDVKNKIVEELNDQERKVFDAWNNILNSKYCYLIICKCYSENQQFKLAFNSLLKEPFTTKLLCSLLYPISFIFSPFMCGTLNVRLLEKKKFSKSNFIKMLDNDKFIDYKTGIFMENFVNKMSPNEFLNTFSNIIIDVQQKKPRKTVVKVEDVKDETLVEVPEKKVKAQQKKGKTSVKAVEEDDDEEA
jgi:hypothetical protein